MTRLKRAIEFLFIFVLFPIAALWVVGIAIAVSPTGFFAYLGALLAAWLLFTVVFPLAAGIMTPDEILAGIRSRRRQETHFEGEPLPEDRLFGSPCGSTNPTNPKTRATALLSAFSVVRVR